VVIAIAAMAAHAMADREARVILAIYCSSGQNTECIFYYDSPGRGRGAGEADGNKKIITTTHIRRLSSNLCGVQRHLESVTSFLLLASMTSSKIVHTPEYIFLARGIFIFLVTLAEFQQKLTMSASRLWPFLPFNPC
jgi:hypothetical protein